MKLGIIGENIEYTLSPKIHKKLLFEASIKGTYEIFDLLTLEELANQIQFLKKNGYTGVNITKPYKIEILKYCDELDEVADNIGSVNTLKFMPDGKIKGYNTDYIGFLNAFTPRQTTFLKGKNAIILGNGGASKAVKFSLEKIGMNVIISHRQKEIDLTHIHLLVNTIPLNKISPINALCLREMPKFSIVYELNCYQTKLLEDTAYFDLKIICGLNMLNKQAEESFKIWIVPS